MNSTSTNRLTMRLLFTPQALIAILTAASTPMATPAQTAPPGPVTAPAPASEKVVELSPFEVRAEQDTGYQAMNTTSGSRLATNLRDTAASISPFTPEFLADIAATNVGEMLGYATNAELNAGDAEGPGFGNPRDFNSAGGEPFRIRGIPGGVSTDYVENAAPQDLYNIERAEVASGPNSILFGSGDAGGLVSLSTKKASLTRSKYSGQAMFGSWAYQRFSTDLNQLLVPKVLAARFNGACGNTKGWRRYDFNDTKRYTAAVAYRPWPRTTLAASYEDGLVVNSIGLKWNGSDQITRWLAAGRMVTDAAANAAQGTMSLGANQRFSYYTQDGAVYNLRNELRTTTAPQAADTLLPPTLFPYDINWAGPSARLWRDFSNYQVSLEQRVTDKLVVQGLYLRNDTDARARSFVNNGQTMNLYADPNLSIPAPGGTGMVANPRAGQFYLESNQAGDSTETGNEIKRLTVAYELELGKWFGRHRIAALGENAVQRRHTRSQSEILVDQLNRPVATPATPEGAQNQLWRRTYLKEGDFSTYALTGLYTPLAPFVYNGLTVSPRQVNSGELRSVKDVGSLMFAAQSTWWKGRLTTTFGYRRDDIVYLDTTSARVTDPADPRVTSGQMVLNEIAALPGYGRNTVKSATRTEGGVLHLHRRLSLFYNQSNNNGAPRFDRKILPNGGIPGTPRGKGRDLGVMIDLLGDDRFFARLTYFDTAQVGDAAVSPSGTATANATALGRSQTIAILQALLAAGKLTQAQYDAQSFNWNAAILDTATRGVEVELIANPTGNWTLRANYSHSLRNRENFYAEGVAFFTRKYPEWRALAGNDAALKNTIEANIAGIDTEISDRSAAQLQGFGSIPHKATVTTRYKFTETRLKGAFVGGAVRYQSKAFSHTDVRPASAGGTGRDYYANGTLFADAFAGYRFRLPWQKLPVSVQVNVRNLTNSYLATTARWTADFAAARRVYLREPRSWRLTLSVDY